MGQIPVRVLTNPKQLYIACDMTGRKQTVLNGETFRIAVAKLVARGGSDGMVSLKGCSLLVALSGGPDSVALLQLLHGLAEQEGFTVASAHLNYKLRGAESDADEQFCIELCQRLGVKLHRKSASLAGQKKINVQDKARELRYRYFDQLCQRHGYTHVAIGHNLDDNTETVLMNLFRGAGALGLSGMASCAGAIIRPLLSFSREQIIEYLGRNNLEYRVDSSNLKTAYTRNRVRLEVLPGVREIFGENVGRNISRAAGILSEQQEYLREQAERAFHKLMSATPFGKIVLDIEGLSKYHDAVRRLILALAYEQLSGSLRGFTLAATSRALEAVSGKRARVDFLSGLFCEAVGGKLYVYKRVRRPEVLTVEAPGTTQLTPYGVLLRSSFPGIGQARPAWVRGGSRRVHLNYEAMKGDLTVRTMRPGDRFQPLGMTGSKKLSDFFVDRKVDRPLREEVPLLLTGNKIAWVIGYEIADPFKLKEDTHKVLRLEVCADRQS